MKKNVCIQLFIVLDSLPTNLYDVILLQRLLLRVYQVAKGDEKTYTIKYCCERKQNAKNSVKKL